MKSFLVRNEEMGNVIYVLKDGHPDGQIGLLRDTLSPSEETQLVKQILQALGPSKDYPVSPADNARCVELASKNGLIKLFRLKEEISAAEVYVTFEPAKQAPVGGEDNGGRTVT